MICSYCGKDDITVDRHLFDGMCVDCTKKALFDSNVLSEAEKNNEKLKGSVC